MKTFIINSVSVDFDETLTYLDFYLTGRESPHLEQLNMLELLTRLEAGTLAWDADISKLIRDLSRWVHEAPRKRHFRNMRIQGFFVMSSEFFFDNMENGDEIITDLENTGKLAAAICKAYGVKPLNPLVNESQTPLDGDNLAQYEQK